MELWLQKSTFLKGGFFFCWRLVSRDILLYIYRQAHIIHQGSIPATPTDEKNHGCSDLAFGSTLTRQTQLELVLVMARGSSEPRRGHVHPPALPLISECLIKAYKHHFQFCRKPGNCIFFVCNPRYEASTVCGRMPVASAGLKAPSGGSLHLWRAQVGSFWVWGNPQIPKSMDNIRQKSWTVRSWKEPWR